MASTREIATATRGIRSKGVGLRQLRELAGKGQAEIASALNIRQPSVSKIEKQTDMHLSTLRSYVEALGGELQLTVKLPRQPALHIRHLGDAHADSRIQGQLTGATVLPRRHHG